MHKDAVTRVVKDDEGQAVLDLPPRKGDGPHREPEAPCNLPLDIRVPMIDGEGSV